MMVWNLIGRPTAGNTFIAPACAATTPASGRRFGPSGRRAGRSAPDFPTRTRTSSIRFFRTPSENWDSARSVYDTLDPHRIYSNTLIDRLLP